MTIDSPLMSSIGHSMPHLCVLWNAVDLLVNFTLVINYMELNVSYSKDKSLIPRQIWIKPQRTRNVFIVSAIIQASLYSQLFDTPGY